MFLIKMFDEEDFVENLWFSSFFFFFFPLFFGSIVKLLLSVARNINKHINDDYNYNNN